MKLRKLLNILLTVIIVAFMCKDCDAQQSDFIVLRKNNKTLQSFFSGSNIELIANGQFYSGSISKINNDSIFIIQYDIRRVPTNLGVYMIDTISAMQYPVYYKDVTHITKNKKGFDWGASGASLFGGGALIASVGLATWLFTKKDSRYYAGPKLVVGAAVAAAAGYILLKSNKSAFTINKKFTLRYLSPKN